MSHLQMLHLFIYLKRGREGERLRLDGGHPYLSDLIEGQLLLLLLLSHSDGSYLLLLVVIWIDWIAMSCVGLMINTR